MGKKILVILGSPRKRGNSAALASALADGALAQGAQVDTVFLNDLDIRPCQGCNACQQPGADGCVLRDGMTPLYDLVRAADTLVIASPVYWFHVSAQAKTFIDRLYAVASSTKNVLAGKQFALVMAYADADPFISGAVNAIRSFQDICGHIDATLAGMVYGSANEPGEIERDAALMEEARQLGRRLASA